MVGGTVISSAMLSDAAGLLAFFSAECRSCRSHMGELAEAARKRRGVAPLTLVVVDGDADVGADLITAAQAFASVAVEPDGGPISSIFRVDVFPTFFRLGSDGQVWAKGHVAREVFDASFASVGHTT